MKRSFMSILLLVVSMSVVIMLLTNSVANA